MGNVCENNKFLFLSYKEKGKVFNNKITVECNRQVKYLKQNQRKLQEWLKNLKNKKKEKKKLYITY